jgi:serine/threonine protein kinase
VSSSPFGLERLGVKVGAVIDSYEIVRLLGEGGMGAVYEARHVTRRHAVAIKVLAPQFANHEALRRRFVEEGQIQAQFRHPNIVGVYDVIAEGPLLALVMEYVPGQTLLDFIYASQRLVDIDQGLALVQRLLAGLGYAHQKGIVHRDIKPDNVILAQDGALLIPRLSDFGVAKDLESAGLTQTGTTMGTAYYMSPEQIQSSRDVDRRCDIYSMGVTVFELFAQRLPFEGDTQWALMKQHVETPPPSLRALRPEISPELDAVVRRALAKDPDERFATCEAMAEALRAATRVGGPKTAQEADAVLGRAVGRLSPPPERYAGTRERAADSVRRMRAGGGPGAPEAQGSPEAPSAPEVQSRPAAPSRPEEELDLDLDFDALAPPRPAPAAPRAPSGPRAVASPSPSRPPSPSPGEYRQPPAQRPTPGAPPRPRSRPHSVALPQSEVSRRLTSERRRSWRRWSERLFLLTLALALYQSWPFVDCMLEQHEAFAAARADERVWEPGRYQRIDAEQALLSSQAPNLGTLVRSGATACAGTSGFGSGHAPFFNVLFALSAGGLVLALWQRKRT